EPRTRAGPDERLRLVAGDPDPGPRTLTLRLATHELCNGLARQAARVPELTDDVQPGAGVHLAIRRADAVHLRLRFRLRRAHALEQLELRRLQRPVLDLGEQLIERVRLHLELLEPRLPGHQLRVARLGAMECALQLDESPEGDRVPVLRRRHALEGLERS